MTWRDSAQTRRDYMSGYNKAYNQRFKRLAGVRIELDTYHIIQRKAQRDKQSIAETVRTLIEWGLEADQY